MKLAFLLYFLSGLFSWFFLAQICAKVDPNITLILFGLLFVNQITKNIILLGDKNVKK